jgi:hypothetical protein
MSSQVSSINLYATELDPISHLLALLGARPEVHISRIKVKVDAQCYIHTSAGCLHSLQGQILIPH